MPLVKKIFLSVISGFVILAITWLYQNYDFSFSAEDKFFKKIFLVKTKMIPVKAPPTAPIIFINTGKDLALVEDSVEYGNISVSDRRKVYDLMRHINGLQQRPKVTVLDLQFYYPYTIDRQVDTLLSFEIKKNDRVLIPVINRSDGSYLMPLYQSKYAESYYRTFNGSQFNKFRIMDGNGLPSIPMAIDEMVNGATYSGNFLFCRRNDSLSLSAIWPNYFITDESVKSNKNTDFVQFYNIGELLLDLQADPVNASFLSDKIIMVGNFEGDVHSTPIGKMSGPVLLTNIYLSLLNKQHYISPALLSLLLVTFSALSYIAWFSKMPELRFNFKFIFSSYLTNFIRKYVSYFGSMLIISLLAIFLFNVQIAMFLPSTIFAGISYFRQLYEERKLKKAGVPVTVASNRR